MIDKPIRSLAEKIWDYHHMHHPIRKMDCLLVLGSNDLRVADHGATLFLDGWAPLIVFSGGTAHKGDLLSTNWGMSEAKKFADVAVARGVPTERILIEDQSQNTGQNIENTKTLLAHEGLHPTSFIVVQKPYMERRAFATFRKLWPEKDVIISSPPLTFDEYITTELPEELIINIMVGDLQRIALYSQRGFQIPQEVPQDVSAAYDQLVQLGFTRHLVVQ